MSNGVTLRAAAVIVPQDFESSLAFVLSAEGGFSDTPGDKGGVTNHGVTQATYSAWLRGRGMTDAPVSQISAEYVEAIYLDFWKMGGCDKLPSPLNAVAFDATVNHGAGAMRPMLLSATAFQGATPEQEAFALLCLRHNLYGRLAAKDPTQAKFLKGWHNRLDHLRSAVAL